jgi:hypothetical protein
MCQQHFVRLLKGPAVETHGHYIPPQESEQYYAPSQVKNGTMRRFYCQARPRPSSKPITLAYLQRPMLTQTCVSFYSLVFQMHNPCMRRELPCSIHTPANQTSRTEHGIHASKPRLASPQKYGYVEH